MIKIQCIKFLKQKYFRCVILETSHIMQWAGFTGQVNLVKFRAIMPVFSSLSCLLAMKIYAEMILPLILDYT